jgi:hypothetical protein
MTRLARIPTLLLLALTAIGVGSVLPFSPVLMAAPVSYPAEEEKSPAEPTDEIKLAHTSPRPVPKSPVQPVARTRGPAASVRPRVAAPVTIPSAVLNNGLSAHYRC